LRAPAPTVPRPTCVGRSKTCWLSAVTLALLPAVAHAEEKPLAADYEAIAVTQRPLDLPGERHIDASTIATTPTTAADDLLKLVPGLLITRHGAEGKGRQIFLRGMDAAHGSDIEVTVDDVPWNEPSNVHGQGYLDLQLLIPETVSAIEVAKGPYRLEQGAFATAASVRFGLGIAPENRGVRVGYEIGSTNRHRALITAATKSGGSFVAAEAVRDGGYGSNRETRRLTLMGKVGVLSTPSHRLELLGGGHLSRFGEPGTVPLALADSGRVGFYDSVSPDTDGQSDRGFLAARWNRTQSDHRTSATLFATGRRLQLQENFTGFLIEAERGDRLEQRHEAWGAGLRLHHESNLGTALVLIAGANVTSEHIDQREDRIDANHVPFARTRALRGWLGGISGQVGARWLASRTFEVEGGLRAEGFWFDVADRGLTETGARAAVGAFRSVLLPRLVTTIFVSERLTGTLAYGRGVRPPEARAIAARDGNTTDNGNTADTDQSTYSGGSAQPTIADGADAGVRWRPSERFELGATGFATVIRREQIFDHIAGANLTRSATRRLGIEGDFTARPWPWLSLRLDATAVDARFIDSERPVPGAPTLFGSFEAHIVHPAGWSGGARAMAIGPRPLAHGARAGSAFIADALVGYRGSWWDLSLTIENLAGTRWREGEYNYASWFDRSQPRSAIPQLHYAAGPPRVFHLGLGVRR
jgi:iron complex outermembrane receptor protein